MRSALHLRVFWQQATPHSNAQYIYIYIYIYIWLVIVFVIYMVASGAEIICVK